FNQRLVELASEISRHRPAYITPISFAVLGRGHIDIQPFFAGADPKAVDLKTAPDGDVGVGQQVSHRSDRPDTHIQLERQVPVCFRDSGICSSIVITHKTSPLLFKTYISIVVTN